MPEDTCRWDCVTALFSYIPALDFNKIIMSKMKEEITDLI